MDLKNFSDEQIAGQRLIIGFNGLELTKNLKFFIDTFKIGGVILFSRNIESPDQLKKLCGSINDFALSSGQPPPFIAVDQEGGEVARLKPPFTVFEGNPGMRNQEDARRFAKITASELNGAGINMNLAPVLDVAPHGVESVMKNRVFGNSPHWVAALGKTIIEELQKANIISVAKHFPGIGRTTLDSHQDLPPLDTEPESLESVDLIPFKAAISARVSAVMLSHVRYDKLDPYWPASLSVEISRKLLRGRMGFRGVVVTDDLDMGAIEKHFDITTAIYRIFISNIDIALICHESPKIERAFETLLKLVSSENKTGKEAAVGPVRRILKLKRQYL